MANKTKSVAKQHAYEIAKLKMEDEYSYVCHISEGHQLLNNIRVEISRLRNLVRKHEMIPKPFKIIFVREEVISTQTGETKFVVKKTQNSGQALSAELAGILDLNAIGPKRG